MTTLGASSSPSASITLTASHGFAGGIRSGRATASGVDGAAVLGSPDALARVANVRVNSTWKVTYRRRLELSVPVFWNGNEATGLYQPGEAGIELIDTHRDVSKNGISSEFVVLERCSTVGGPLRTTMTMNPLSIVTPGPLESVSHTTTAIAYGDRHTVLGRVSIESSTPRRRLFELQGLEAIIITM
jgi:hypothetical protein